MENLESWLREKGIWFNIIGKPETIHTADAAVSAGVDLARVTKSLIFLTKDNNPVFVIIPGNCKADIKKIEAVLSTKDLVLALFSEAQKYSGYAPGATPPILCGKAMPTIVDKRLVAFETIFGGGGSRNRLIELKVKDIIKIDNAHIADIVCNEIESNINYATNSNHMATAPFETIEQKKAFWHSTSHILADAVKRLWPDVKLGIGPAIDEGFYYDFGRKAPFTPEDLIKIEAQMKKIIKEDKLFKEVFMPRKEAEKFLAKEPYKLDLLKDFPGNKVSFHQHGNFIDLCNTPIVKSAGQIKAFKLLSIAAAYWRGDSNKPQLQRIYGISFPDKEQLDKFLKLKEEAEKRDHRKIGKQLGLFTFSELIGPGIPLFTPKGEIIRHEMEKFIRELQTKAGYQHVWTGHIAKAELYKKSGHIPIYQENMFPSMKYENEEYILKPMNCPSHIQIYASQARSYRDLPLRFCEFATLYRHEESGAISGLVRVRSLTQDDCHVFCRPDQVQEEIAKALDLIKTALKTYGLNDYWIRLSLRDPKNKKKYLGNDKVWNSAESALKDSLKKSKIAFDAAEGEAAFYGPKMDLMVKDVLGREWQLSTIQLDFNQPERFKLEYNGEDNKPHRPVMIHRAVIGSTERFLGVLIEQYAGAFPLWLSPVQVKVLSFTDRNFPAAKKVENELFDAGIRVESDYGNNTVDYKVRAAELEKVPYILVIGDKEEQNGTVAVRKRGAGKVQFGVKVADLVKDLKGKIERKSLEI